MTWIDFSSMGKMSENKWRNQNGEMWKDSKGRRRKAESIQSGIKIYAAPYDWRQACKWGGGHAEGEGRHLNFRHHDKETNQWRLTLTLSEWGISRYGRVTLAMKKNLASITRRGRTWKIMTHYIKLTMRNRKSALSLKAWKREMIEILFPSDRGCLWVNKLTTRFGCSRSCNRHEKKRQIINMLS